MSETAQVMVVGGGISGLACAYRLCRAGISVKLIESQDRVGGLIGTVERDGFVFDTGPQSFQGTATLLDLIRELGLEDELQTANPQAPRFVLAHGKLRQIPMSPQAFLTSSLLGVGTRFRVASEILHHTKPPAEDESVANFVRRKFGHEILEYLVSPFVSGVYAGDPEKLSLRAAFPSLDEWERRYGSVVRGAIKARPAERKGPPPLCSFRGGVGALTGRLAEKLASNVLICSHVAALRAPEREHSSASAAQRALDFASGGSPTAPFHLRIARASREGLATARAVVLATPAHTAANLLGPISSALSHALASIAYAPVAVIAAGYRTRQIGMPLDGFGFLAPRREQLRTLGTIWNSSLFPGRAPEGMATLTSFAGGATDMEIVTRGEDEIAQIVERENAKLLEISGPPVTASVWRHQRALPQYNLGHGHLVETIRASSREIPGLFFAGNYLAGPSLGNCVEQAFRTADEVIGYIKGTP
jgi:protoporphyrinogen/coproporphyrinogen III oxidase